MTKVSGLYSSRIEKSKACGWCAYHRKYLTVKQLKAHKCLQKNCDRLIKYESHEWWRQREIAKAKRKANKEITNLLV